MASIIANGPGTPMVTRGKGTNLGTLAINAGTTAVQFTVSQLANNPNGFDQLTIFTVGGTIAGPILEVSIDGGNTWATIVAPTNASSATTYTATAFGGDVAVSSANGYTIASLSGLGLFRWGATVTVGSTVVWAAIA
jgi:hypothetical protein